MNHAALHPLQNGELKMYDVLLAQKNCMKCDVLIEGGIGKMVSCVVGYVSGLVKVVRW